MVSGTSVGAQLAVLEENLIERTAGQNAEVCVRGHMALNVTNCRRNAGTASRDLRDASGINEVRRKGGRSTQATLSRTLVFKPHAGRNSL